MSESKYILPPLRFDDGDFIVKLYPDPSKWLLIHSEVVKRSMTQLSPVFDDRWAKAKKMTHPVTGKAVNMYTIALKLVDQTLVLEDEDFVDINANAGTTCKFFSNPDLSTCKSAGFGRIHYGDVLSTSTVEMASKALHVLFAMMYGFNVPIDYITGCSLEPSTKPHIWCSPNNEHMIFLFNICAYAEYHMAMAWFAPFFTNTLLGLEHVWNHVSENPQDWLRLGKVLRCSELYFDAARHLISKGNFENIAIEFEVTEEEAYSTFNPRLQNLKDSIFDPMHPKSGLLSQLERVGMTQHYYSHSAQRMVAYTTFLRSLSFRPKDRSQFCKSRELSYNKASQIYLEWLGLYAFGGEVLYTNSQHMTRAHDVQHLNWACQRLIEAAQWETPADVFEYKAAERNVSIWSFGSQYGPARQIRERLNVLVAQAAECIENAFPTYTVVAQYGRLAKYNGFVFRRSHYDAGRFFTYLPIDEEAVPWGEEMEWEEAGEMPNVDMAAACEEVLEAYGLVGEANDVAV